MNARVKIGRARLKTGGATIVPMPSNAPVGHTVDQARAWFRDVMTAERAPDAICAVAIWLLPEQLAYPMVAVRYASGTPTILTAVLPDVMAGYVRKNITAVEAEGRVMETLGYRPIDDPDPAA